MNTKSTMLDKVTKRFQHYPPRNKDEMVSHEHIRLICRGAAEQLISLLPDSTLKTREFSQVLTDLENAMMHANAAYARHKPEVEPRTAAGSLD